ncbi:DUF1501 domain-containing protein [Paracoccus sp. S-4012]|uniref:DUF1501 domain-containing protein n=1 Tax=Paracoccus sp. S-4012 TaxID=2665648 RepID=UPI0012AFA26C|nr:DUF1501 domain-containing protein [Paracoccus sp. S-4012]MRX49350.1 DUF1501 domain-containing protein [Paracoccus sp. S-4012]
MNRRGFLRGALIGCSAAAMPWLTPVSLAAVPGEGRLVVIVLRGAMDGLDVVQPWGDPALRSLRATLSAGPEGGAHDLDGFFALHPALGDLMPLWRAGELSFAHAVSTPYRNKRSHFDGQDLLEAGLPGDGPVPGAQDGWLNRLLQVVPGTTAGTAWSVGNQQMLVLNGEAPVSSWSPEADLAVSPQARMLLERIYEDDPLFAGAAAGAVAADDLDGGEGERGAAALAAYAAARLNEEARIASFSINGWDSHGQQQQVIGTALKQLGAAILALREGLGRNWDRTVVMAVTEFGRTVRQNGNAGTDHGTGGAMLMAGGGVRGGRVFGDWPGLGEGQLYQDRDLMPTGDVRSYPAWAMAGLFGLDRGTLERVVFPGLDLGRDPGILA